MGAFDHLSDADLEELRSEEKIKTSGTRLKQREGQVFWGQQFELVAAASTSRVYRLYRRHNPDLDHVFSVGLQVFIGGEWLTLCRYNGSYHPHRNHIERNRLVNEFHIHTATERYIANAEHPDGYAVSTDRYTTVEGALRCMLIDCNIKGVIADGDASPDTLDFGF